MALKKTIGQHPSLCYGLVEDPEASTAHFVRLETIQWDDIVETQTTAPMGMDDALCQQLGFAHSYVWKDQHDKPPWKIIVIEYDEPTPNRSKAEQRKTFDVVFLSHHAISDGVSTGVFHKYLLKYMHEASSKGDLETKWPFIVPGNTPRPIPIETCLNLYSDTPHPTSSSDTKPTKPWTGTKPTLSNYSTSVLLVTVPAERVPIILGQCRRLGTTLTGLLHGIIAVHLSLTISPQIASLTAITPYSLRRFIAPSTPPTDTIACHMSYFRTVWPPCASIRRPFETPSEAAVYFPFDAMTCLLGSTFRLQLEAEFALVPTHGPSALSAIASIPDLDAYCAAAMEGERGASYELSNLGVVDVPIRSPGSAVQLEKLVFSQCAMVTGAAIGVNVVGVRGGPLTMTLTWQEGAVEYELMKSLQNVLGTLIRLDATETA